MAPKYKDFIQIKASFVEINLCDNKLEVLKILKGKNTFLTKRSFWVDMYNIFPFLRNPHKDPRWFGFLNLSEFL